MDANLNFFITEVYKHMGILKDHSGGKFLASSDLDGDGKDFGMILEITDITEEDVSRQDDPESQLRPILHFKEAKPLVLNKTNLNFVLGRFGEDEKKVIGNKVLVWCNPDVEYAGKVVKGLRLADPKEKKSP
jgi:hypothetical protein